MKDIFSELYKKVLSFFNNESKEENSKDTACNRLKLVLMQDRAKMEPALMEKMREEMIAVISKYVEIDKEALDLNLEAEGESFALMLNIPVIRAKTREEIEEAEGIEPVDDDDDEDDDTEENEELEEEDDEDDDDEDSEEEDAEETSEDSDIIETSKGDECSEDNLTEETTQEETPELTKPVNSKTTEETPIKPSVPKNKYKHQKDEDL